jgi:hypothetical protein
MERLVWKKFSTMRRCGIAKEARGSRISVIQANQIYELGFLSTLGKFIYLLSSVEYVEIPRIQSILSFIGTCGDVKRGHLRPYLTSLCL